jgi:hypothetical protein
MHILMIIMFAPLALWLGFLVIRVLMEPAAWVVLGCLFALFLVALVS